MSLRAEPRRKIGWYLILVGLPALAYLNSLGNPFQYDDFHSIVDNPHIRQLGNIPRFFVDSTLFSVEPGNAMYRPLLLATFALNHALSGYEVWSYHLVGIIIHAGCALLVWGIGRMLLRNDLTAGLASLLFGLHPVNAEAVNYISSRSELLGGFFLLLGFWFFLRSRQLEGSRWPVAAAFAAGLLCKSIVIALPAVMLIYDLLFARDQLRRAGRLYGGMLAIALLYLGMIGRFLTRAVVGEPVRTCSEQLWTQVKAVVFYLKLLLWPSGLSVDHQFLISDSLFDPFAGSASLLLISLCWLAWYHRGRHPLPILFLAGFGIALAPASLVPLNVLVNEHRLYMPSVFFVLTVAYFFGMLSQRGGRWRTACGMVSLIVLFGLATRTWERNQVWRSLYILWEDAASKAPLMARPHIFLGNAHAEDGRREKAIQAFEKVLLRDPGFVPAYIRLGRLYREQGRLDTAVEKLQKGLGVDPQDADLWSGLGDAYRDQARWRECVTAYRRAVELLPQDDALRNNLGNAYQMAGNPQAALEQHQRALEIDATRADSWLNLGNAFWMLEREQQTLEAYLKAIALNPKYAGAWANLGHLHEQLGQKIEALEAYRRAVDLDPQHAGAWVKMGYLYEQLDQRTEALKAYENGVRLDPGYTDFVEARRRGIEP